MMMGSDQRISNIGDNNNMSAPNVDIIRRGRVEPVKSKFRRQTLNKGEEEKQRKYVSDNLEFACRNSVLTLLQKKKGHLTS